jgi:peroxiredoxin
VRLLDVMRHAQRCLALVLLLWTVAVRAQATDGVTVGDVAPSFSLKNIDGSTVSLSSYSSQKGAIIVFTCNHCPYSVKYEDRIIALHEMFAPKGYPVIAINPNDAEKVPEDSFENMKIRASERKFTFPYLIDDSQQTALAYGAKRTPHVFVVSNTKEGARVMYIGAIDDNATDADAVETFFVRDAVSELLAGGVPTKPLTKAIGCSIKWKNK